MDDLLPAEWSKRRPNLGICGRLDKLASGLVIMSQDGQWSFMATAKGHEREYEVELRDPISAESLLAFASGELILRGEEKPLLKAQLTVDSENDRIGRIVLREGRYHQVRRMFASQGNVVLAIKRIRVAGIELGSLAEGESRKLTPDEISSVLANKQ